MSDKMDQKEIIKYIRGDRQSTVKPEWLASLIDDCRRQANIHTEQPESFKHLGYKDRYELLQRLLTGSFSKDDAQNFIDHLLFSPAFFQHVTDFFHLMQRAEELQESGFAEEQAFSDAEMLSWVKCANMQRQKKRASLCLSWIKNVFCHLPRPSNKALPVIIGGALAGLMAFFLLWPGRQSEEITLKILAEKEPYISRTAPGWRSDTSQMLDSYFKEQNELFKIAMSDYVIGDYQSAINRFQAALDAAEEITSENAEISRDIMFYSALSHLYLARNTDDNRHDKLAIHRLEYARTITENHNLKGLDEIRFFMGLSQYRMNNTKAAQAILSRIDKKSRFYQNSQLILEQIK